MPRLSALATLRADLEPHLTKEEQVLFPMARELAATETAPTLPFGSATNPVSVLLAEHDVVGELLGPIFSAAHVAGTTTSPP